MTDYAGGMESPRLTIHPHPKRGVAMMMQPSPGNNHTAPLSAEGLQAKPLMQNDSPLGSRARQTTTDSDSSWSDEAPAADTPASAKRNITLHLSNNSIGQTIDLLPSPSAVPELIRSPSYESADGSGLPSPSGNTQAPYSAPVSSGLVVPDVAKELVSEQGETGGAEGGGGHISLNQTPRSASRSEGGIELTLTGIPTDKGPTLTTTTTSIVVSPSTRPLPDRIVINPSPPPSIRGKTPDLYSPSTPSFVNGGGRASTGSMNGRARGLSSGVSFQSQQNPLDDFNEEEFLPPLKQHFGPKKQLLFLDPSGKFKLCWSIVLILFIMYSLFEVPMSIGFGYTPTPELKGIAYCIDVFFLMDVLLNFITGYHDEQLELVHDPKLVAMTYLRGWFLLDVIGSIPFDLASAASGGNTGSGTKAFFALRALKIPRLFRMVKLTSLLDIRSHRYLREVIRMVKLVLIMVTIGHWIACGFMLTARSESDMVKTWAAPVMDEDIGSQYVFALYWSLTVLSTVGFGDIVPLTQTEMIYTCCTMLLGAILYAVVVGNVMLVLANLNAPSQRHVEEIMKVADYMRYRQFPAPLMKKVIDFTEAEWKRMRGFDEKEVMAHLPESLQTEVARHLHAKMLSSVSFFKDSHSGFINAVVLAFHTTMLLPNTIMLRRNQPGDKLWFISKGSVELIDRGQVYAVLGEGSCVGESALLDGLYRVTARTATYCELCVLYRSDFDRIVKNYPEFIDIINAQAEQTTIMASKMAKLKQLFS